MFLSLWKIFISSFEMYIPNFGMYISNFATYIPNFGMEKSYRRRNFFLPLLSETEERNQQAGPSVLVSVIADSQHSKVVALLCVTYEMVKGFCLGRNNTL